MCKAHFISCFANSCNLIKFLKQYLNIFVRNFVLCIQIRFVSTEKNYADRLACILLNHLCYTDDICLISLSSDNVVRYYIVYSMYGFVTFVCIFIFVHLCYNENNSFLKIILFSYLYE